MSSGRLVPVITTLAGIVAMVSGLAAAQSQFVQSLSAPASGVLSAPEQRQPLFPVPPAGPQTPPQTPAVPLAPVPPAAGAVPGLPALPNLADALIQKPRIVCGMTLIPAAPAVDPKIATKPPAGKPKDPTTYTIRAVQPTLCW